MIELLQKLVAVPSVSGQEDAAATLLHQELEKLGLRPRRMANNVWCEVGDAERPRLLLNSHLDTVPPAAGWVHDPWLPQLEEDRLSGLGANDAKGCVAALIQAVVAIRRRLHGGERLGGAVVLALTAEEEISGQGLAVLLPHLGHLDAAIVGEPTGLAPVTAQRGLLILRGIARGRAGHPANTPADTTDNAVLVAACDLVRLTTFDWGPEHPLLGRCHAHVTKISGGTALNVIPDVCEFFLDVRTTPLESHPELCHRLRGFLSSELHVHSERLRPVETPAHEPIVQAVLRALHGGRPAGSPTMSDMVFLNGVPSVKIGPGDSRRSHTANEYVTGPELAAGAAAYERIIIEYLRSTPART